MTKKVTALQAIAAMPPVFQEAQVRQLVAEQYGLDGDYKSLVSERDQNFRLTTAEGSRYVVKIASAAEDSLVTDFQIQALLHLQNKNCRVAVPRVVKTRAGEITTSLSSGEAVHALRVVTYLGGRPLDEVAGNAGLARSLGTCLADLDAALSDFDHPGECQELLWDMQRAGELHDLISHMADPQLQDTVRECLDDFGQYALPEFASLRRQVIHNDINPDNVLVTESAPVVVAGVIDFGDMIRAPLIVDVAIAASYLRSEADDALAELVAFVAAYNDVTPLDETERNLLYDLVRMRLATTITIRDWRMSARPAADAYLQKALSEHGAEQFLARIGAMRRDQFSERIRIACGH
jgi:hydroxylysine kinase